VEAGFKFVLMQMFFINICFHKHMKSIKHWDKVNIQLLGKTISLNRVIELAEKCFFPDTCPLPYR